MASYLASKVVKETFCKKIKWNMEFDQYFWQGKTSWICRLSVRLFWYIRCAHSVFLNFFKQWREIKKCGRIPFFILYSYKKSPLVNQAMSDQNPWFCHFAIFLVCTYSVNSHCTGVQFGSFWCVIFQTKHVQHQVCWANFNPCLNILVIWTIWQILCWITHCYSDTV